MLNEIKECDEYLHINSCKNPRIIYSIFSKPNDSGVPKFQGIPRILTILARYYLFTEYNYYHPFVTDSEDVATQRKIIREKVKTELQNWMHGPLKEFLINEAIQSESKKRKKDEKKASPQNMDYDLFYTSAINKKNTYWNHSIYYIFKPTKGASVSKSKKGSYTNINTANAINYSIIIASAINQGPLCNQCLVVKKDAFSTINYFETDKKIIKNLSTSLSNPQNTAFDRLLKYIAGTFPSLYGYPVDDNFIPITKTDLSYWTQYSSLAVERRNTLYLDKDRNQIIEYGNNSLSRINPNFIHQYDVQLMTVEAAEQAINTTQYKDYLFFEDNGVNFMSEMK